MRNNIDIRIEQIKKEGRMGIMTHLITGYPTLSLSQKIARVLVKGGADIVEIQIPFSDPMADGPLIVEACQQSLDNGTKVSDSFKLANFVNNKLKTPVVLMTYVNIVIHMGIENFCNACKKYGVSGVIIPDLPYDSEESILLKKYANKNNVHVIYVISPAIEEKRLQEIKKQAGGFIYCTSRQGTTGTGKNFTKNLSLYLSRVKKATPVPIAVGFGMSSKKDFDLIHKYSQIGIVGSAIVNIIKSHKTSQILPVLSKFMFSLTK